MISGYLYCVKEKQISSFARTAARLLKPYIWFNCLAAFVNLLINILNQSFSWQKGLMIDIYRILTFYGIHAIWYISSYIIASYLVLKAKYRKRRLYLAGLMVAISIACSYLFRWMETLNLGIAYYILYYPIAALIRGGACSVIMAAGYEVSELLKKISKKNLIFILLVCFAISITLSKYTEGSNFSTMNYGEHPIALWVCMISGAFAFFILFYFVGTKGISLPRFLSYYGKNSLILLVTHSTLKLPLISWKIVELVCVKGTGIIQNVQGVMCLIIILLIEIPVIYCFTQTPLKKFVG